MGLLETLKASGIFHLASGIFHLASGIFHLASFVSQFLLSDFYLDFMVYCCFQMKVLKKYVFEDFTVM